ncbi:MAG: hypothetical protein Q9227_000453 [Pyrenula ochraceoflavens]
MSTLSSLTNTTPLTTSIITVIPTTYLSTQTVSVSGAFETAGEPTGEPTIETTQIITIDGFATTTLIESSIQIWTLTDNNGNPTTVTLLSVPGAAGGRSTELASSSSASSSTPSVLQSPLTGNTASPTVGATSSAKSGLSSAAKGGIGAGVAVLVALMTALLVWTMRVRLRRRGRDSRKRGGEKPPFELDGQQGGRSTWRKAELEARSLGAEQWQGKAELEAKANEISHRSPNRVNEKHPEQQNREREGGSGSISDILPHSHPYHTFIPASSRQ